MESPKTKEEINNYFQSDPYIKETFSNDTLRIYINSLRKIGCEITRASKTTQNRYVLCSHPFQISPTKAQLSALVKLYKNIYEALEISQVIEIEELFNTLAQNINDEKLKKYLLNSTMLKGINKKVLKDLISHCKNNNQIEFLHNSPRSGPKAIDIIADKLEFKSAKLYLWGYSLTHKEYSFYRLDRIEKILNIKLKPTSTEEKTYKITYQCPVCKYSEDTQDKIIEKNEEFLIVETTSKNKFNLIQKFLYNSRHYKVISPESFKHELIKKLKLMKENYND
jgi:predicted DNA-binding transcriptional regulator YafY